MKILLWHGYLLAGSGSNVYTANVARVWRDQGHDVLLLCQDRHAGELDCVDEYGEFAPGNASFTCHATPAGPAATAGGRLRVVRPDIGEILPVYVYDPYEGFTAKRFTDLTDDELAAYVGDNADALATAIASFEPDRVIVGHEVMGPYIARDVQERSGVAYSVKLHGSALEYAVKVQDRYRRYATQGFATAHAIVGTSRYMCEAAAEAVPGDWPERSAVVNPGCDVELFVPRSRPEHPGHRRATGRAAARAHDAERHTPTVGFVGKFIAAKGPQNLLAALGLTTTPGLHAVLVGYGDFDDGLRGFDKALRAGDVDEARARLGDDRSAAHARDFLGSTEVEETYLARYAEVPVAWPGRLDHDRLPGLLPDFDVLVVPSEVPEAFGMVGAEAAAAGVLPIVPRHSGIGEIGEAAEEALGAPRLLRYDPDDPVRGIAERIDAVFTHNAGVRASMADKLVHLARDRWSWDEVATRLLDATA